ncbi:MAG: HIRAN domain-containing protein [Syntrophorhabdaceae bacterium]|nr:HIRAN domain-containing protein [Syntrophorhabdaceae bacterium]
MERRGFLKFLSLLPVSPFLFSLRTRKEDIAKKVLLLDTVVAGFRYYDGERIWDGLSVEDPVTLIREPENPYDQRAIEVYHRKGKIGYIPRVDNTAISQLMDRREKVYASISWLKRDDDPWKRVGIKVWLEV